MNISKENFSDYVTPPEILKAYLKYIEKVTPNKVSIDLDVASNEKANAYIRAKNFYSEEGLKKSWSAETLLIFPPSGYINYTPAALKREILLEHQILKNNRIPKARLWFRKAYTSWVINQFKMGLFIFVGNANGFVSILKDPCTKKWGMPPYCICDNSKLTWHKDTINKNSGDFTKAKSPELCVVFDLYPMYNSAAASSDYFNDTFENLGKIID